MPFFSGEAKMYGLTRMRQAALLTPLAILLFLSSSALPATPKKARTTPRRAAVLPAGKALDSSALAHRIDQALEGRLKAEGVAASPLAGDAEFLRRVYLDLTGHIPPTDRVVAFLNDRDPKKRARLIDELLASPEYGKRQADLWQKLLVQPNSNNRFFFQILPKMKEMLEGEFNKNKPWDAMVRELVTATGPVNENLYGVYLLAAGTPDKMTDSATRLFLGVQLQCAQCHNHPFADWKQTEYWGMAAFFTRVRFQGNPRQMLRQGTTVTIREGGRGRAPRLPVSAKRVPPKFLQGKEPNLEGKDAYRTVLAHWMTAPQNPYFSKAMVNRTWGQLFGRGLVNPVDDMHEANPASHPQLLTDLSRNFAASGFDLKYLIRSICNSRAYQRTSKPFGNNRDAAPELYSRMAIKVFSPEQTFDSLQLVLGRTFQNVQRRGPMGRRFNLSPRTLFVASYAIEDGADPTELQAGVPQVLRLMNGPAFNNGPGLARMITTGKTAAGVIEQMYLAALARRPTVVERDRLTAYVNKNPETSRQAYIDVLWAVLNSSEFTLNH
jgi:hypothetical protein